MTLKFWQVDAFATKLFGGNPAAVFILEEELSEDLMQNIAAEMNLSETAFVLLRSDSEPPLLRWFTPKAEIDLCGHATLASAHILFNEASKYLGVSSNIIRFDTQFVGPLCVKRLEDSRYEMCFPSRRGEKQQIDEIPSVVMQGLASLSKPVEAFKSRDLMLVYDNEKAVFEMKPNFHILEQYEGFIIVTAPSSGQYDFISRFFCAGDGIAEDPVTGSAHCTLAPYWAKRLSKNQLLAYQASERGGVLNVKDCGENVLIAGQAITVFEGNLFV
ncbi:MAG TPA: PhzF family phenazine biosynthesis protein [Vampirovibrionales bacterium]